MSIVSSTFKVGHPQVDERRYVSEEHVDVDGKVYSFEYLGVPNADHEAIMVARAATLSEELARAALNLQPED